MNTGLESLLKRHALKIQALNSYSTKDFEKIFNKKENDYSLEVFELVNNSKETNTLPEKEKRLILQIALAMSFIKTKELTGILNNENSEQLEKLINNIYQSFDV